MGGGCQVDVVVTAAVAAPPSTATPARPLTTSEYDEVPFFWLINFQRRVKGASLLSL